MTRELAARDGPRLLRKLGDPTAHIPVEVEFALLDELKRGDRRDGFRDRGPTPTGVRAGLHAPFAVFESEVIRVGGPVRREQRPSESDPPFTAKRRFEIRVDERRILGDRA
jgi:hypothetical protein